MVIKLVNYMPSTFSPTVVSQSGKLQFKICFHPSVSVCMSNFFLEWDGMGNFLEVQPIGVCLSVRS